MHTNRVFGTAKCVLFIEVSSFQGVLNKGLQQLRVHVCLKCVADSCAASSRREDESSANEVATATASAWLGQKVCVPISEVSSFQRVLCTGFNVDVSLLERCPHFRGCYVQASM